MKFILKRSLSVLLAIAIIFSSAYVGLGELDFSRLFAVKAEAASESDLTFVINDDYTQFSVKDCKISASGSLVIPATYNGKPVTSIGNLAFADCTSLTSITIPDSVTSIGRDAFARCTKVALITIPDSVISIGDYAFSECRSLTSIIIPDSVTMLGELAFSYCTGLSSIKLSDNLTSIEHGTFNRCSSLKSITIPDSVTSIGGGAFSDCIGLTSITIPDNVTSIGYAPFKGCTNISETNISENNIACVLDDGALFNKAKTKLIQCFENNAIYTIPDSVTDIGEYAFYNCTNLVSIKIPTSVLNIEYYAFGTCKNLKYVFYKGLENDWSNILIDKNTPLTNAVIHYNSTDHTYSDWVIDVEPTCTVVGQKSHSCSVCNYKETVKTATSHYYSNGLCKNCGVAQEFTYTVENNTVTITGYTGTGANVVIPSLIDGLPVTTIGDSAFYNCTLIESVELCDGVKIIEGDAFYRCSKLNLITIPDSVNDIGIYAFYGTKYYNDSNNWENDLLYIGNHLIKSNMSISGACEIKSGTKTIAGRAFADCYTLKSVIIPDSVTNIGTEAFMSSGIESVTFGNGITDIGYRAFGSCKRLSHVFYKGSESDWSNITIGSDNSILSNMPIHFNATDHTYQDVNFAPTCTNDGGKGKQCIVCGCTLDYETIPATGHQTTEWITEQEPNCTESGYKDEWCLDCGEIVNTEEIPATGHQTTEWITEQEPNCTEAGYKDEWCLDCGELINTEEIPELGHSYGDWIIDTEPTCTEDGSKHQICSVCGDVKTEIILSEGHSFSIEWRIDVAPTCTEEGSKSHHCTACEEITDVTVVEALGHTYSTEWTIDVKATCTEEGSKSHHCVDCDNAKADVTVVAPLGHNFRAISVANEHPHIVLSECSRCPETKKEESYSEKCGVCNFTYTENADGTCKITAYTGSSDTLIIPATINGKTVATTNTGAFKNNTTLTSVKIENGVQGIGSLVFIGCSFLSEVVVPESVTNIGSKAFYNCSSDLTIYCYSGSYAMQYAIDNSLNYEIINIGETDNCTIDYDNKIIFANDTFATSLDEIADLPSNAEVSVQGSFISGSVEIFGTGSKVTITDGDSSFEYTLVINGDLNGDGTCDVIDASLAYLYSVDMEEASEIEIIAANGCVSEELDANSYQNVVNMCLT